MRVDSLYGDGSAVQKKKKTSVSAQQSLRSKTAVNALASSALQQQTKNQIASDLSSQMQKQEQLQLKKAEAQTSAQTRANTGTQADIRNARSYSASAGNSTLTPETAYNLFVPQKTGQNSDSSEKNVWQNISDFLFGESNPGDKDQREQAQADRIAQLEQENKEHGEDVNAAAQPYLDYAKNFFMSAATGAAGHIVQGASTGTETLGEAYDDAGKIRHLQSEVDELKQDEDEYIDRVTSRGGNPDQNYIRTTFDNPISKLQSELGYVPTHDEISSDAWQEINDTADKLSTKSAEYEDNATQNMGTVGKALTDLGISGLEDLMDYSIGAITGTGSTLSLINAFGKGAQEAKQQGGDVNQQFWSGVDSMVDSAVTDKIVGLFIKDPMKTFLANLK